MNNKLLSAIRKDVAPLSNVFLVGIQFFAYFLHTAFWGFSLVTIFVSYLQLLAWDENPVPALLFALATLLWSTLFRVLWHSIDIIIDERHGHLKEGYPVSLSDYD